MLKSVTVRTTLEIDDDILRQAKLRAAERGRTLGELVTEALSDALRPTLGQAAAAFRMPVFGEGKARVRGVSEFARLRDDGR